MKLVFVYSLFLSYNQIYINLKTFWEILILVLFWKFIYTKIFDFYALYTTIQATNTNFIVFGLNQ
jgi:hypothetical protein